MTEAAIPAAASHLGGAEADPANADTEDILMLENPSPPRRGTRWRAFGLLTLAAALAPAACADGSEGDDGALQISAGSAPLQEYVQGAAESLSFGATGPAYDVSVYESSVVYAASFPPGRSASPAVS